ncbi:murein biosynthesis integral membrane protein MurJ [Methylocella sp.]|uniref:murein biosynthesis integral membrane protein MurJ n=1 Tax=Methylocella sp. TaxID=1978226 RepID=UPI003782F28E
MYKNLLSVGGLTLLSRAAGFLRDVMLGAVLGAGLIADAFVVAQRLPNHFRAVFGEGAWNAAFVPTYSRALQGEGLDTARRFSGQIFVGLLVIQLILLALALLFTPTLIDLLAPGFRDEPEKFALTEALTRITFPYLLFVTLVTLQSGALNAHGRFVAAAFAPVLMNLSIIAFLTVAFLFPNAGAAAAWGLMASGAMQLALTSFAAWRAGILEIFAWPRWSADMRRFLAMLGPAVIGSAGVQIALFADTIIGSMLPTGGPSSIYYADRIYQLPLGVIGIAAGTVLLPQMSRLVAAGRPEAAISAQNRTFAISLILTAPFFVAFLAIPDLIMRGVFLRGAFTPEAAQASAAVLAAYGLGILAVVLLRSAVPSFQAAGDTTTPMIAALVAVAGNVALKVVLFTPLGAPGLATATSAGAWINLILIAIFAMRRGLMKLDAQFMKVAACVAAGSAVLVIFALSARAPVTHLAQGAGRFSGEATLTLMTFGGASIYGLALIACLRLAGVRLRPLSTRQSPKARPNDPA